MIDIIINTAGGLTLVYDGNVLDGCNGVRVDMRTGVIIPEFPDTRVFSASLNPLVPSVLDMLAPDMKASLVKMNGWSLAKASGIGIRLLNVPAPSREQPE